MKKIFKTFLFSIFIFIIFSSFNKVEANSISNISMDIYVDHNGTAHVTEIWNCTATQGTEVYHPYYNLGNSKIKNLSVQDGKKQYTTLSSWNTSGSLSQKAEKCGINYISNGVELCWGISNYGSHTYKVTYQITNFVSELTDSQMIYWTLIPYDFSNTIGKAYIKIYSNFNIPSTVDVWGYGNQGTAYVYDGYIEMQSDGTLEKNEYMTILVKFPLNTFLCNNKLNDNFDTYYNMAEEGAIHNGQNISSIFEFILVIFSIIFPISIMAFVFITVGLSETTYDLGSNAKNISKNVEYFRDIPCNNDLFRTYYIAYRYKLLKNKTDLLGAIILKWLKDDLIKIEQKETGKLFQKENTVVILTNTNPQSIKDKDEFSLFNMLYKASKDGILENKEFEKWCSKSYSKILSWFDGIIKREQNRLINNKQIVLEKKKIMKFLTKNVYHFSSELEQEALQIAGLKRFLVDYSLIKEKQPIEVHLFEYYLIYAQLLGIAKKVAKDFKELYPDVIEQSHYTSYDNILFVHMCASSGISHANSAKARAESYSSSGGGGGSFGGGGGGGGFR